MDSVVGEHAVNHTLQDVSDLFIAWSSPTNVQADIARSAATILSWLRRLCYQSSTRALFVSDLLIKLAQPYISLSVSTEQKVVPSTKDRVISALDHHEHSVQFWVLDCVAEVLSSMDPRDTIQDEFDAEIPKVLIKYCFSRLSLAYSVPVQTAAGRCLSALSKLYIEDIVELVLAEMKKCSSDTQIREFVIVQRAIGSLEFSTYNLPVTIKYLEELAVISTKIDRGVLRSEICMSLKRIMHRMLGRGYQVLESSEYSLPFWNVFARLYRQAAKWAKKVKHAVFCYSFMISCVCLGQLSFFTSSNREDVYKLVINGLRKEELRHGCIAIARDYIRDVNSAFFRDDMELFNNQVQVLVLNVLPKKKAIPEGELPVVSDILVAVGRKHVHYLINEIAVNVLKPKSGYTDTSKCALLSAMCTISNEVPDSMEQYCYTLGPLISAIIESDSDSSLLCAALSCFPAISHSKWERLKMTGARVASLTLSTSHDVAVSASGALHRFAIRNPQTNLLLSLYSLIDVLSKVYQDDISIQIRIMSNVKVILASYDEYLLLHQTEMATVPFECWIAVRHHLEGIVMLWLLHPESWVRREAYGLLQILGYSGIRQLDRNPTSVGTYSIADLKKSGKFEILVDYLKPNHSSDDQRFCPELNQILLDHYSKFEGVIAWTWSIICDNLMAIMDKDKLDDLKSDDFSLWKNHFTFLCLGMRLKPTPSNELTTEKYRADYQTKKDTFQYLRYSFVSLHLSSNDLTSFAQHILLLLRVSSRRVWKETRKSLADLNQSVFDSLAQQLRSSIFPPSPTNAALTLKKKSKRNQFEANLDYFFHDRAVVLYERVFLNVKEPALRAFENIISHLQDFVSAWMQAENQQLISECAPDMLISMMYLLKKYFKFYPIITEKCLKNSLMPDGAESNHTEDSSPTQMRNSVDMIENLRHRLFTFITSTILPRILESVDVEVRVQGQIAACDAITSLVEMGPILDQGFLLELTRCLSNLESVPGVPVAHALTAILSGHPSQLLNFLTKACDINSKTDVYIHAVCSNLQQNNPKRSSIIDKAPSIDELEIGSGVDQPAALVSTNPCVLLVASLLCQTSPYMPIRRRALQMGKLLEPELGDVVSNNMSTHLSLDVCTQMAYNMSEKVAFRHFILTSSVLDAASFFAYHVPESASRILLELCIPWLKQFARLLELSSSRRSEEKEGAEEAPLLKAKIFEARTKAGPLVWPVLNSLLHLTKIVQSSVSLEHQIGAIWRSVGDGEHDLLLTTISSFLDIQFGQFPTLCSSINLFLLRSDLGKQLADVQLQRIRQFQDDIPIQKISIQNTNETSDPIVVDWNATSVCLALLTDAVYEKPEYLRDYLPLLVHIASVLNLSVLPSLLIYSLSDLGIALKLEEEHTPSSFAAIVSRKYPTFAKHWCKIAWDWAVCCPDRTVAERSLQFYCTLNVWFDLRVGLHLSIRIRHALHNRDVTLLTKWINILVSIPLNRSWTGPEWTLYMVLGFSLLAHSAMPVFQLGLKLLDRCKNISTLQEKDQIIVDLQPLWSFSSIVNVISKGFSAEPTFASTLQIFLTLSRAMPHDSSLIDLVVVSVMLAMMIELETRKLIINDALVTAVIEHLGKTRPPASVQMGNLHRVIVAICSGSPEDFRTAKRSHVESGASSPVLSGPRQSIISTVGRGSIQGTRRMSRVSMISARELNDIQNSPPKDSGLQDTIVCSEDLLNIVPELCRRVLHDSGILDPKFVVGLVEDVLCSNEIAWRKPCLWLLDSMLDELQFVVSPRHFAKLGEILTNNCHDPDLEIATAAEIVCARLFDKCPESYHNGAFRFFRSSSIELKIESTFLFDKTVTEASFKECIRFFDGPVVSLIHALSTLYTPLSTENMEASPTNKPNYREGAESTDFSEFPVRATSDHRGSIDTIEPNEKPKPTSFKDPNIHDNSKEFETDIMDAPTREEIDIIDSLTGELLKANLPTARNAATSIRASLVSNQSIVRPLGILDPVSADLSSEGSDLSDIEIGDKLRGGDTMTMKSGPVQIDALSSDSDSEVKHDSISVLHV